MAKNHIMLIVRIMAGAIGCTLLALALNAFFSPYPSISPHAMTYNVLTSVSCGTPSQPDSADRFRNEDLMRDALASTLEADIHSCMKDAVSLREFEASAFYKNDELQTVMIGALVKAEETPSTFFLAVANKRWSQDSSWGSAYAFAVKGEEAATDVGGVDVMAYVLLEESADGAEPAPAPAYIATFTVGGYEYIVEARDGVTADEFGRFIRRIIEEY